MADSELSASELRTRYGPGGSVPDSELSAAQLRSRYDIQNNSFKGEQGGSNSTIIIAILVVLIAIGAGIVFMNK
jgi:hypothetical protein